MNVYIYQAALYCEDCGKETIAELERTTGKNLLHVRESSDIWPQGPYPDGGGEADCPQHCDGCGIFLENPLTGDGQKYVIDAMRFGSQPDVLKQWREFYSYLFNQEENA
jgi:hypothetical protein